MTSVTGCDKMLEIVTGVASILAGLLVLFMAMPVVFRTINEISCRLVERAITICPHCGVLGVVETDVPKVFR